jgi:hypothetical protein
MLDGRVKAGELILGGCSARCRWQLRKSKFGLLLEI